MVFNGTYYLRYIILLIHFDNDKYSYSTNYL